jgi:hypothetical protein
MKTTPATVTVLGREVARADVLRAIAECEKLGRVRFLRRYGYREATRYVLRHDGRSYPSKAILGVAANIRGDEQFFGGARGAAGSLARLGFHVRNVKTGAVASRELDSLRRACAREGLDVEEQPWPDTAIEPAAYFASGSNRPAEIRGFARAGADIGVTVSELSPAAIDELEALAGSDVLVFVDSGAFSEVKWNKFRNDFDVVRPITDEKWRSILGVYKRLARALGDQVFLVAPDRVGHQRETLARLTRYAADVRECAALGARILVPVQKGEFDQAAFAVEIDRVLGVEWFPAFPCKKAATTPTEIARFVERRRPTHVHLLGKGPRSRDLDAYLAPFARGPWTVSLDSCWLTQNTGRTNGPKGGPRRMTRARDSAERVLSRVGAAARWVVAEVAVYCCVAGGGLVR